MQCISSYSSWAQVIRKDADGVGNDGDDDDVVLPLTENALCARNAPVHFMCITSVKPHSHSVMQLFDSSWFHRDRSPEG